MARLLLTVAGYAIGGMVAGPLGARIGGALGSMADASMFTEDQHHEGSRLDDLVVSGGAADGASLPIVYGDMRVPGQFIVLDDLQEHKSTQTHSAKGSGGSVTQTSYSYSLTYAVAFAEPHGGQADLRRAWSNKRLTEDYSGESGAVVESAGDAMYWYDGSQTEPDGDLEALIGAGNVPAYRGICYGVYTDRDLTAHYGNRPPAAEAEVVASGAGTVSSTLAEIEVGTYSGGQNGAIGYSEKTGLIYASFDAGASGDGTIYFVDPFSKKVVKEVDYPATGGVGNIYHLVCANTGFIGQGDLMVVYDSGAQRLEARVLPGFGLQASAGSASFGHGFHLADETKNHVWGSTGTAVFPIAKNNVSWATISAPLLHTLVPGAITGHPTEHRALVGLSRTSDSRNGFVICNYDFDTGFYFEGTIIYLDAAYSLQQNGGGVIDAAGNYWWAAYDSATGGEAHLVKTDAVGNVSDVLKVEDIGGPAGYFGSGSSGGVPVLQYNQATNRIYFNFFSRVIEFNPVTERCQHWASTGNEWALYHAKTATAWHGDYNDGGVRKLYANQLRGVTVSPVDVADIVGDLCERAGLAASDYDTSGLSATVGGFSHTRQGPALASIMAALRLSQAYMASSDWALKFVQLGAASVRSFNPGDLAARAYGEEPLQPVPVTDPPQRQVPSRVQVDYLSTDNHLQPGMVSADNPAGAADFTVSASFAAALSDQEAADLAAKLLQIEGEGSRYGPLRFMPINGDLDAGDAITINTNQGAERVRLVTVDRGANGVIEAEGVADNQAHLVAVAVPPGKGGQPTQTIRASGPAQLVYLDTPTLRDQDSLTQYGPYLTAWSYGTYFPGAVVYKSADGQTYDEVGTVIGEPPAGFVETVPAAVDFEDFDTSNTLRVTIANGEALAGTTDANLLNNQANAAAWGAPGRWEIVQFGTVVAVPGESFVYDVSRLLRGRRGTDGHMGSHQAGDQFVLLTSNSVVRMVAASANIGNDMAFKVPLIGAALVDAAVYGYTIETTEIQRAYSPVNIVGTPNATTPRDLDVTWTWRCRQDGVLGGYNNNTDGIAGRMTDENTGDLETRVSDATVTTHQVTGESHTLTAAEIYADYGPIIPYSIDVRLAQDGSDSFALGTWREVSLQMGFTVLDKDGNAHLCAASVLNSSGVDSYCSRVVRDADGNNHTVI